MCSHVGNQRSRGVVISRLRSICSEPSSSTSISSPIDLPLPLKRLGTNLSRAPGRGDYVLRHVVRALAALYTRSSGMGRQKASAQGRPSWA
jgi:hypothetical protein